MLYECPEKGKRTPESWIPPGELRDQRELLRTRMALRDLRSSLKHRIHSAIDRYGLHATGIADLFGVKGRAYIDEILPGLPKETARMVALELDSIDQFNVKLMVLEQHIDRTLSSTAEIQLLQTLPGVGKILAPVLWLEIGDIERFPEPKNLASYAGLVVLLAAISSGRPYPSRRHLSQRQPLSQVGVRRGRHLCDASARLSRRPHRPALSTTRSRQGTRASHSVAVARHLAEAS